MCFFASGIYIVGALSPLHGDSTVFITTASTSTLEWSPIQVLTVAQLLLNCSDLYGNCWHYCSLYFTRMCFLQGSCMERDVGPVCKCRDGFSGVHCEASGLSLSAECDLDPGLPGCELCEGRCKVPDFNSDSFLLLPLEERTCEII